MARDSPPIGELLKLRADRDKDCRAGNRTKSDQQENRPGNRIVNEFKRPRKAGNDDKRQREDTDDAVDQNGIRRTRPASTAPACKKPYTRAVASNRRGQHLIKERCDEAELQSRHEAQSYAARDGNCAPAKG